MNGLFTMRNLLWALALGVTVWLTINAPKPASNVVDVTESTRGEHIVTPPKSEIRDFVLTPRIDNVEVLANLFSSPAKTVQKPVIVAPRAIAPIASLPFEFVGFVEEQGTTKVILDHQGDIVALKAGDSLNGYKLLTINKTGGSAQLKFLFIPKNLTQTMVVNNE